MDLIRVGLIGCGKIATKAHIPCFKRFKDVKVSCVADVDTKALRVASKKFKIPQVFTNYEELLEEDLDLVDICSPPSLHAEMCVKSAEKVKNILVEKPLAVTVAEAEAIKKAVDKNNVNLCIMQNARFFPSVNPVKQMLERGELGRILTIHVLFHQTVPLIKLKIDHLLEFIHGIDLMAWIGGQPKRLYAKSMKISPKFNQTTEVKALIEFENQCVGLLDWSCFSACDNFLFEVYGTGSVVKANLWRNTCKIMNDRSPTPIEEMYDSMKGSLVLLKFLLKKDLWLWEWQGHLAVISAFLRCIKRGTGSPIPVEDGLKTLKIVEGIKKSISTKEEEKIT